MSSEKWTAVYYETRDGEAVVENEIKGFGAKVFARIVRTVGLLEEFGTGLDEDYVKHVEGRIWELRPGRYRVLYSSAKNRVFVLLRAFIKKSKKTPKREIKIAQNRLDDYTERYEK